MKLYKTSKAAGIVCVIFGVLFIGFGVIMMIAPDEEGMGAAAVLMFILALIMLIVGIVSIITPTKTVELVDNKLVFNRFKCEPKNSVYLDETKKILTIPTSDIVDFQVQGQSKSNSFWATFLGGAVGAAIAGSKNPDKLIVKTKESQVVVFIPQVAGNKIKGSIKLEQEEAELDPFETTKSLDKEE